MKQPEKDRLAARARTIAEHLLASGAMGLPDYLNILAVADELRASEVLTDSCRPNRMMGGAG